MTVLSQGMENRQVASTSMNRVSSRSHAIFMLKIKSVYTSQDGLSKVRTSKFTLVDLAGSERQKSTETTGDRLKEATNINKSLLCLGSVINALAVNESGKDRHIPFRNSKVTFLLRDSFGGNSKTCLVATVSPAASSVNETLSTLKFAQGAKLVRNMAVLNEDTCVSIESLQAEVLRLKYQLQNKNVPGKRKRVRISSTSTVSLPPLPPAFNRKATFYESDLDSAAEDDSVCSDGHDNSTRMKVSDFGIGNNRMIELKNELKYEERRSDALKKRLVNEEKMVNALKTQLHEEKLMRKLKEATIQRLKRMRKGELFTIFNH